MAHLNVFESFDTDITFDMDSYAKEALEEGAKVLEARMKANARASIKHDGDSELVNSIKASKVKKANGAYLINVGPRGYSKVKVYKRKRSGRTSEEPVSNALKAIWKEYGIPGYRPAQPFISPTVIQTETQITDILQKKYEEKLK